MPRLPPRRESGVAARCGREPAGGRLRRDGRVGFVGFLSQLRGAEVKPARSADGIVVLTGGSSRVSDAMELLAGGYGRRLLISGVHPTNDASDISRSLPDNSRCMNCCVDLDRSAVNTRSNAAQTRRWAHERGFKSLIVVTSNYHMPRAIVELSHAMPDIDSHSLRGGRRQMARGAVVDQWRDVAAAAIGICQICRRRGAGAAGGCRLRRDARGRTCRPARSHRASRRRHKPTDRVVDGLDFPAFVDLQRAVLSAARVLADRRRSRLS